MLCAARTYDESLVFTEPGALNTHVVSDLIVMWPYRLRGRYGMPTTNSEGHSKISKLPKHVFGNFYLRTGGARRGRPRFFGPPSIARSAFIAWSRVASGSSFFTYTHMRG